MRTKTLVVTASFLVGMCFAQSGSVFAQSSVNPSADNSAMNERDRGHANLTAMDQSNKPADLSISREIRKAVVEDADLSTEAKNVKIITIDGAVTLRGPVKNAEEKADIENKAVRVAGQGNVHNQLEVAGQ